MKPENADVRSMDDLVFENRNKEYGAYAIRKTYPDNLNKALMFVFGSVVVVFMLPLVLPFDPMDSVPTMREKEITILKDEPTIKLEQVKQEIVSRVRKAVRDLAPVVTTDPEPLMESPVQETVTGNLEGVDGGEAPVSGNSGVGLEEVVPPVVIEAPKVWDNVEVRPQYNGGMEAMIKYLQKKLKYPPIARRLRTEGSVYVSFVVNTDGSIIQVKILKGISKECDEEAARVIAAMPPWTAGRQGNVPVLVRMVLPIKFQLND